MFLKPFRKSSLNTILSFILLIPFAPHIGPGASISAAQPVQSFLQSQIGGIEIDPGRQGVLKVFGNAAGEGFSSFALEFGSGEFPIDWKILVRSERAVQGGLLSEWNTAGLDSGIYALRLTVKDPEGRSLRDRKVIDLAKYRPDLAITRLEAVLQDTQLSIRGIIENRGAHSLQGAFSVDFYLSQSEVLDKSAVHLERSTIQFMEANGVFRLERQIGIPHPVKDGEYLLFVILDQEGKVVEVDKDNNLAMAPRHVILSPDLEIYDLTAKIIEAGQKISVTGTVRNQGNRPVQEPFKVALFLSLDAFVDDQDFMLTQLAVKGLKAGSADSFNLTHALPPAIHPGTYFILARIDPEGTIYESDRSNNSYFGTRVVLGPDLVVTSLTNQLSGEGSQLTVHDRIKNEGRYPVQKPFKVTYSLSSADTGSSYEQVLGSREILSLEPGETSSGSTSFSVLSVPKGIYLVHGRADIERTVLEMNRDNNEFVGNKIQIGPDLTIRALAADLLPNGDQIEIKESVKNRGSLPVNHPFRIAFYLSPDGRPDPRQNRILGSRQIQGLGAGEESTGTTIVPLPSETGLADSFIVARVDPEGLIGEIETGNNFASAGKILEREVDLIVADLTATLSSTGNQMRIKAHLRNLGPHAAAGQFSVAYYLSGDGEIDPGDHLLGERRVEGLRAGVDLTEAFLLDVPPQTGIGKLSVLARVDSRNEVRERREDNNDYWGSSLHLGPDLILTNLGGEVAPDAHEIVISVGIKNQGNRAAPKEFKVSASLSEHAVAGPNDLFLGSLSVLPVPPGEIRSGRIAFPLPSSLKNGSYFLHGRVDPDNEVEEVEEANNDLRADDFFLGPDLVVDAIEASLHSEPHRIRVDDTVRNQGNRPAPENLEVSYFLSRNWTIDGEDIYLGSRIIAGLKAGESSAGGTLLSFSPKEVPTGRYFLLGRVDGGNTVAETNEANNVRPTLVPMVIRQEPKK